MQINKEADFLLKGNKVIYPPVRTDGLELYYDVKGKKNSDLYKDKLLDMSGNGRHGELHDFNYKNLSGYQEDSELVFDGIDDTLKMPKLNGIDANNFTYQLNNNILAFTGDEVKTVKNGDVEVGGRNLVLNTQGEHEPTIPGSRVYLLPLTNSSAFLGEELTFSFKAKSSNGTNRMYISIGTGGNTRNNITRDIIIPKEYKEFKYTFTASTSTDTTTLMIVAGTRWHPDNYGSITVTDIKLEKGNIATDWTPAPEDLLEVTVIKGNFLGDMEDIIDDHTRDEQSGVEVFTDKADDSLVRVEVDGKSYQGGEPSPDYPIEIHSLNDFDVVSSVGGRNYLPLSKGDLISFTGYNTNWEISDKTIESVINRENHILNLTLSYDNLLEPIVNDRIITFSGFLKVNNEIPEKHPFVNNSLNTNVTSSQTELEYNQDTGYFKATYPKRGNWIIHAQTTLVKGDKISIYKPKIEKGNKATDWTPAPEDISGNDNHPLIDKINLSLSEPLRSVGDVKDRLFRDSDGLWKVERNVGKVIFNGSENWRASAFYNNERTINFGVDNVIPSYQKNINSNRFTKVPLTTAGSAVEGINNTRESNFRISIDRVRLETENLNGFKTWLDKNPTTVIYEIENPTLETLDQELQDKLNNLRSFQGSNYIYTVINDKTDILPSHISENLKPIIHTEFLAKDHFKENRTVNNLLIWNRSLEDDELLNQNKLFHERFNMRSNTVKGEPINQEVNLLNGGVFGHSLEQNYTIEI